MQFVEQLRVDLSIRQWSVDVSSFSLGSLASATPDAAAVSRPLVVIVPISSEERDNCVAWIMKALDAGRSPFLIAPEEWDIPNPVLSAVLGVNFRGSLTYDQIFESIFRHLLGPFPGWLDVIVRPSLLQSPTGIAWWADDLFVADDKFDHVVRVSANDSTVIVPGLFEPHHVSVDRRQLTIANKSADEILYCDVIDNMASNVEVIHNVRDEPLRHPHAAFLSSRLSAIADTDNDRVVYSTDSSLDWRELKPSRPLSKPCGVCADEGGVWVADTFNHRVVRFDVDGKELMSYGSYGDGSTQFTFPVGIQRWRDFLFVADELSERLKVFQVSESAEGRTTLVPLIGHFAAEWVTQPFGVSINRNNRMAIADRKQKCIWTIDLMNAFPSEILATR